MTHRNRYGCIVALLVLIGCGGGESSLPSIDGLTEGEGPTLDLADPVQTADVGKSVVTKVNGMTDEAASKSLDDSDTVVTAAQAEFCAKGAFTKTVGPHLLTGGTGKATFAGNLSLEKSGNDGGLLHLTHTGTYENYSYPAGNGKSYTLTGTVATEFTVSFPAGITAFCANPKQPVKSAITMARHTQGALSVANGIGAAITFDFAGTLTIPANVSPSATSALETTGTATIKSDGEETTCQISGTNALVVSCL